MTIEERIKLLINEQKDRIAYLKDEVRIDYFKLAAREACYNKEIQIAEYTIENLERLLEGLQ